MQSGFLLCFSLSSSIVPWEELFLQTLPSYCCAWLMLEGSSDCPCWDIAVHPNKKGTWCSSGVGFISHFRGGRSLITWIFVFFQFGGNRFYIFYVCFSADVKQNCLTSKSSFRGCLRNLVLTKGQYTELFDFSRAFDLRGVFPHSCPGAEHWTVAKPVWTERRLYFLLLICYFAFSFHNEKKNW